MADTTSHLHAYFAGLFDGEGHVELRVTQNTRPDNFRLRTYLHVSQKADVRPLFLLQEHYGGSLRMNPNTGVTDWRVGALQAETFARDILPYVIVKKAELELWLEARASAAMYQRGRRTPEEEWDRRRDLEAQVFDLRGGKRHR